MTAGKIGTSGLGVGHVACSGPPTALPCRFTGWRVARLAELYREEEQAGAFHPRVAPDLLAYAVVRLTEGFIYNDALGTVEPAVDRAAQVVALMLD